MVPSPAPEERADDDTLLEAAYRAEFGPQAADAASTHLIAGRTYAGGTLRALALHDLSERVARHGLLRRADDTARQAALRFVERRLGEGHKVVAYEGSGSFAGFLRRVLHNLLLDWLRSPAGRAELRRAEHDGAEGGPTGDAAGEGDDPSLPGEEFEAKRRRLLYHVLVTRALKRGLPPARGVVVRLALWPAYEHDDEDVRDFGAFAHCHEGARSVSDARGCDTGKRCAEPPAAWRRAYETELAEAKASEPQGLSRKAIATLTRIGHGKPMPKREGAVCERISKGRMQLVAELRRAGIHGVNA
jgi:DNA-directed RNA polymerase specialized sigma24 family protein